MRKLLHFFLVIFSFSFSSSSAENALLLTNPKTGETTVFREGSYLVFELNSDRTIREGYIRSISDSSLSFEDLLFESQVSLSEITVLAGSTKGKIVAGRVANAVGNALVIAGTSVLDCGANLIFYSDYYYWPIGGAVSIAGAWLAGMGYLCSFACLPFEHSIRVRNYRNWDTRIVQEEQPETNYAPPATAPEAPVKEKKKNKATGDDVYGG